MGNQHQQFINNNLDHFEPKLSSELFISNSQQFAYLVDLIQQRSNLSNPHILTVKGYKVQENNSGVLCGEQKKITIVYQDYDCRLDQHLKTVTNIISQDQVLYFLSCIVDGLNYFHQLKMPHGDVSPRKIVKCNHKWKIIDQHFLEAGVTAYQRVLQGKQGFISPQQMKRIRQGYVLESPPISEKDDIFALGMTILQLMSGKSSIQCYNQSFIRLQSEKIKQRLIIAQRRYQHYLYNILKRMLQLQQKLRINLKQLLSIIKINSKKWNDKISMKKYYENHSSLNSLESRFIKY